MAAFFHYRNLFPNFKLETSEFFCKWCMRRSREISPAKHVHLLGTWIVALDGLYSLMDRVFKTALESRISGTKKHCELTSSRRLSDKSQHTHTSPC